MSRTRKPAPIATRKRRQPRVSALLWMSYQSAQKRQLQRLQEHGFGDLNPALLSVMVYPHPENTPGDRPLDTVRRNPDVGKLVPCKT